MKKVSAKDLLLYLLYLGDNKVNTPIEGTTRIQKMFFLFEKEILPHLKKKDYDPPEFFAYNYGPYSSKLTENIDFFINMGFVSEKELDYVKPPKAIEEETYGEADWLFGEMEKSDTDEQQVKEHIYALTPQGVEYVRSHLLDLYDQEDAAYLKQFKNKICSMPLNGIIDYVYHKYEEMTFNSLIKDKVFKND